MRLAVPLEIDPGVLTDWRQDAPIVEMGGETMGTEWRLRLAAPETFDRDTILKAIEARLEDILAQMSHWRADSVLGRFNRASPGAWIDLPADFAGVMTAALAVAEITGSAFDPTIGALVDAWGHGPVPIEAPPGAEAIATARALSGRHRLTIAPDGCRLLQPGGLRLDLSGIAKGYAVDALSALLRERGCNHFLVEIGGELVGAGMRPDGDPWWVDLETPAAAIPAFRIALHQLAVATSGDYVRGRHTIDPRTGHPVEHSMSVSVLHASAMLADAWATALTVERPAAMRALATGRNLSVRAIFRTENSYEEWISPALNRLVVER